MSTTEHFVHVTPSGRLARDRIGDPRSPAARYVRQRNDMVVPPRPRRRFASRLGRWLTLHAIRYARAMSEMLLRNGEP